MLQNRYIGVCGLGKWLVLQGQMYSYVCGWRDDVGRSRIYVQYGTFYSLYVRFYNGSTDVNDRPLLFPFDPGIFALWMPLGYPASIVRRWALQDQTVYHNLTAPLHHYIPSMHRFLGLSFGPTIILATLSAKITRDFALSRWTVASCGWCFSVY